MVRSSDFSGLLGLRLRCSTPTRAMLWKSWWAGASSRRGFRCASQAGIADPTVVGGIILLVKWLSRGFWGCTRIYSFVGVRSMAVSAFLHRQSSINALLCVE